MGKMIERIDWVSFTFAFHVRYNEHDEPLGMSVIYALVAAVGEKVVDKMLKRGYMGANGRPPYRGGFRAEDGSWTVYFNDELPHALCEFSGKGCEWLEKEGELYDLLHMVADDVTRIDLAVDWLTGTKPSEFAEKRANGRFKAIGTQVSETGETVYVGSKKSDRYARVYRYNPPHPRSAFLRCEMVYRRKQARVAVANVCSVGLTETITMSGNGFGWTHELWESTKTNDAEMLQWRPERRTGKTLRWLIVQVAPAIIKLAKEDEIDPEKWFSEYVLEPLKKGHK